MNDELTVAEKTQLSGAVNRLSMLLKAEEAVQKNTQFLSDAESRVVSARQALEQSKKELITLRDRLYEQIVEGLKSLKG